MEHVLLHRCRLLLNLLYDLRLRQLWWLLLLQGEACLRKNVGRRNGELRDD